MTMSTVREIPFARPWIEDEDRRAVAEVLSGHILTHGPQCKSFESEFAAFLGPDAHCVTVSSCMAALHLSYLHFGIGAGDEVIVPSQTHAATAHAVEWAGATPVFVDCDPATGNMTPDAVESALTAKTKAVSMVHFAGIPCDMPGIMEIAERHDLKVIEDCALALGTRVSGKHAGMFGDAGCFSFYPVKHITTGEGGMFVSRHREVAEAVGRLRAFGVDRTHTERTIPGMYDVPELGLNYRMSEMQAALGRTQLGRFPENLRRRKANFGALKKALSGVAGARVLDARNPAFLNSWYCLILVLEGPLGERRNEAIGALRAAGIGTSIYYPKPVPRMTYYSRKYSCDPASYANSSAISDRAIALPVGPHLTGEDLEYLSERTVAVLKEMA